MLVLAGRAVAFLLVLLAMAGASAQQSFAQTAPLTRYEEQKRDTNAITVSIVVSGLTCTCARFAEDIRNVVNDLRPGGIRVLPILGVGGFQNIKDVLFLRGVDMAVVDQDNLKLLKKTDPQLYANLEQRVLYITKLYNAEFHVLAREEIKSLADLKGKKVNFNLKNSQSEVTADNVFDMLKIDAVRFNYDNDEALAKVISGELSAMIAVTGAPQSAFAKVKKEDGLHLLPIDEASLPGYDLKPVFDEYLPAEFNSQLYPNLIAPGETVPTIANRALLAVYNWPEDSERYRKLARFVDVFFSKIEKFHEKSRHPKWKEINLAADVPGWIRFKPARQWLEGRPALISGIDSKETDEIRAAWTAWTAGKQLSDADKQTLFKEFKQYLESENAKKASR